MQEVQRTIDFADGFGISDDLSDLIANELITDDLETALASLSAVPTITLSTTDLSEVGVGDAGILDFNALAALGGDIGGITGTISDDNGTYLLAATDPGNVTALAPSDDDDITLAYGTVVVDDDVVTKLIENAQLDGTTRFTGDLININAQQATDIGNSGHINDSDGDGAGSNNISTMTLTVDAAISPSVASNLADKGDATFSAGLTGQLSDYDDGSALTSEFDAAVTEHDAVDIVITDDPLAGSDVDALNRVVAAMSGGGDVQATISAESGDLDDLTGFTDNNLTITVTNEIGITALGVLQGTSSNAIQISGSISDSLSSLYDASNDGELDSQGSRASALNDAIAGDNDVIVIVEDNSITSADFAKLNAIAGHGDHAANDDGNGGYIEATVSGTAAEITSGDTHLDNLSTNDQITFTVTGTSDLAGLQSIDDMTALDTIDVEEIEDSNDNILLMTELMLLIMPMLTSR